MTVWAVTDTKVYEGTLNSSQTPIFRTDSRPLNTLYDGDTMDVLYQTFTSKNVLGDGSVLVPYFTVDDGNGGNDYAVTRVAAPARSTRPR